MRALATALLLLAVPVLTAQQGPPVHGSRPARLEIRDVHVVPGDGTPAYGPVTVVVEDGGIVADGTAFGGRGEGEGGRVLDGAGRYLLPGLVSTHAHLQSRAAGIAMPREYSLSLWLACGVTALRDVGSNMARSLRIRSEIAKGELAGPRVLLYPMLGPADSAESVQQRVASLKQQGADGIKLWSNYSYTREQLEWILHNAAQQELPVTAHIGIGPTDAVDYAELGVASIEHWYGIPDAALEGVQDFPPDFSYSDEVDRFRYAGRLWREADPEALSGVLQYLVDAGVAWSPTLAVYEASRDLVRAQNKPWFDELLHPALESFFSPSLEYHGSYFLGWTSRDEAYWRENYRIWMAALREFEARGGTITTGEDAAYIYLLYGFGLLRELELHLEAGFHPLEVVRHATHNGARVLGREDEFGRVKKGLRADLILVEGNPLENLKLLYPTGTILRRDGEAVRGGGIAYTIVDGRVYHVPTLLEEVRGIVAEAR